MKAILVVDMPTRCDECPLHSVAIDEAYCNVMKDTAFGVDKPAWCPLKPIPEKRNRTGAYDFGSAKEDDGWNSYYDELMGEHIRGEEE